MTLVRNNTFYPDIFVDAVRGNFVGKKALQGSPAVLTNPGMPDGLKAGDTVKVPYFNVLGELQVVAEDVAAPMSSVSQSSQSATVLRASRAFEMSRWKQLAESSNDPYGEFARQLRELVDRAHDGALIAAACASSGLPSAHIIDRYNASAPVKLSYDQTVSGQAVFGDEQEDIAMVVMHSKPYFDLMKTLDGQNRPLLTNANDGGLVKVAGMTLMKSDRCLIDYAGSGAMVATGTSPPAVTVTGETSLNVSQLQIDIVVGGALATATFRYSFDGGVTWSSTAATAPTVALVIDNDTTKPTGLTANFPAGTYNADNVYTGVPRYTSAIVKKGALGLWFAATPVFDTDKDILKDNVVAAIHSYFAPVRYSRTLMGTRPGVVVLKHN